MADTASGAPGSTPTAGQQIVFIDGNVPDLQILVAGVKPGIQVVILDPNGNGVQQMADYLSSHDEHNLDAIQIVSHGEDATVRLGNTILGLADISMFSTQLATIGQALKPGGDILFYGCNVGEGFAGALFEIQISMATGGAHVAASSGLVGAAALGGSWTLDVADGTIEVGNPFTAATLGQYGDILTNQIWFSENNGTGNAAGTGLATLNVTGSTSTTSNGNVIDGSAVTNPLYGTIALDAADGFYFITNNPSVSGGQQQILRGSISGGALTAIHTTPDSLGRDFLGELVYSPVTHKLYFAQADNAAPDGVTPSSGAVDSGIFSIDINGNSFSSATRLISYGGASGLVNPYGLAIDATNNLLFFTDFGDSHNLAGTSRTINPRVEVANLTTGVILNSNFAFIDATSPTARPNDFHFFYGIDVDPATKTLYWTSGAAVDSGQGIASNNQILRATYDIAGAPSNVTALFTATDFNRLPTSISIDVANGVYYAGVANGVTPGSTIVEGSLTGTGTPTTIYTLVSGSGIEDVLYEAAPVLSVTGASPIALPGGAAVDLTSSVTVTDTLQNIASATVTISSGRQTGDVLSFHNGASNWVFSDGTITGSYTSGTGVLALSGVASAADYQQALDSVSFATTATTGTSRSFSWSTTDGHLASATASSSATVHLPPVISTSATATFNGGGAAVVLDGTQTVSSPSTTTLASATISIDSGHFRSGDSLNFVDQGASDGNIAGSYNSATGVLTLTSSGATATLAQWQVALRSITYSFAAGGDSTNGGGDTTRTITWTVNDGTSNSASDTSTLNTVHTAPAIVADGTPTFTGGGSPVTLDSTVVLTVPDSAGNLASATVTISSGLQSVDRLSVNGQSSGTIAGTNITVSYNTGTGVLTLSGTDTAAHYDSVLEQVQYSVTANGDPTAGGGQTSRTISWTVNDGSTSNGSSAVDTSALTTVHTAPTVTVSGTPHYAGGGPATTLDSGFTVTDPNSGGNLASATVKISSGFLSGDTLAATTTGTSIVASYASGTGILTLTGTDTIAHYQTVMQSITYSSSATDPTNVGADLSRTIQWTVNDGSTSNGTSNTGSLTLGVSVGPVIVAGASVHFDAGSAPVILDSSLTVSDVLTTTLAGATVSITSGFLSGDTLAATTTGTSIVASYNTGTGVLTLSGTDTLAHYQTVLESVTYQNTIADPTSGGTDSSRTITWTANDGSNQGSATSAVLVRTAPSVTAGASVSYTEQGTAAVLDAGLTLSDPDSPTLAGATVSIGSFFAGDTLNFTNQNGISGSYNSGTGVLTLTGSATAANYQTALDSITFSSTSDNPTNFGTDTSRTVTWIVNDGALNSNAATSTVAVTAVNDAPVVTAGGTVSFTEQGSAIVLASGLTVSDADNTTLAGATVSIGSFLTGDTLNFTDQNGITGSYDGGTGVLTLSGSASVADYQTALRSITYSSASDNPTGFGANLSRTISWTANDGALSSTAATSTVAVTAVNDVPVVTAGATVSFTEQGSAVVLDAALTVSDVDNTTLAGATVSIGGFLTGDTLNFTNQNGITGSYSSGTGVLTLTGSASVADYQAALRSISFSSTSDNPTSFGANTSRTISWTANDGTADSTAATSTVNVTAVNDAPVVTAGATVSFTEQGSAVVLDAGLTLNDADNTTLASATVSIGSFLTGDTLNFTNQNGITGSYSSGTGVLTLTGSASVADYQAALRSISFSSTSDNPTSFGANTSRTISWTANDGTADSTAATSTVNVTVVNDAPVVTAGATVSFTEQGSAAVLNAALTVSDADNTTLAGATVSISSGLFAGDTLNFTDQNGISGSYDSGTGVLTLAGSASVADYQAALRSITYSSSSDNPTSFGADTSRTITWQVNDGALNSTSTTSTANITAVNDAPVVTAGATVSFTEQGSAVVLDSGLTLSDPDNTTLAGATVSIGSFLTGDTLNFTNQNGISGSYSSGTGVLTLTGSSSVANYQAALQSVTLSSASDNPTNFGASPTRTISWTANDGALDSTPATSTVAVTAVNDAPVVTAGATVSYTEQGSAAVLDAALTVSDVDNQTLAGATVSISAGLFAGDTLNFTNQNGISGSYDGGTGVLTLTGSASVANYQAALRSITYSSTSDNPTDFGADTSRTITWVVNDGALNSPSTTSTANITAVNDAPVVTASATASFTEQGSAVVLDAALTLNDADNTSLASATVSISGFVAGDTLNFTDQSGITGSYDGGTGVLTLTGSASVANYQTALRSITYSSASDNPTNFGANPSRTISWTANDGALSSTIDTSTVVVTAVDDAPVVTAGGTVSFTEQSSAVTLASGLTLSDVDNTSLAGATVSIGRFLTGDTLNFTNQNGITGSYDGGTGVLTLTGSASVANYQAALRSITFSSTSDNPTDFGADTSRTITWVVNDGALNSTSTTSTANITAVNDAPVVTAGATVSFAERGSAVVLDAALTLNDADNTSLAGATVSISAGLFAGDTLNFTNQNGITGSYDSGTGVLTLTGSASVANYQAALRSITFSSASDNPTNFGTDTSRTLTWQVNDGALNSTSPTSTLNITAVDDAPVVTAGATASYTEQGTAAVLNAPLTVSDVDNQTLTGATVSITSGLFAGDTLAADTTGTAITATYNSGTGVLTLSGTDTVVDYQAVLASVTFSSTSHNPTNFGTDTSRTISWTANDGALSSTAATSTLNITAVDDAPVVTAGATATFNTGGGVIAVDGLLTISDVDSTTLAGATVSMGSNFLAGDTLNFTNQNGITGTYDGSTGVLTLTGTSSVANYQTALRSITFSSASGNPTNFGADPARTLSWTATDGLTGSSASSSTLVVNGPPPSITGTTDIVASYIQQATPVTLDNAVTASDIDGTTLTTATVTITGGLLAGDTLAVDTTGTNIAAVYNAGSGVLTLSGTDTIAHYNGVLQNLIYSSSAVDPTNGGADRVRTISWQVGDGKSGNNLSNTGISSLATHVRPVVLAGATATFTTGEGPVLVDPTVTATNADTNPILSAQVAITAGLVSGDTLAFNNGTNTRTFIDGATITASYNAVTGVLALTQGAGPTPSTSDFQQALQSVTFANSIATATTARTLSWTLGTADPRQTSVAATSTLSTLAPSGANGSQSNAPQVGVAPVGPPAGPTFALLPPLFGGPGFTSLDFVFELPPTSDFPAIEFPGFSPIFGGMPAFFAPSLVMGKNGIDTPFPTLSDFAAATGQPSATPDSAVSVADDPGPATPSKATSEDGEPPPKPTAERDAALADRAARVLATADDRFAPDLADRNGGRFDFAAGEVVQPVGRLALSAQLRAAGRQGFFSERQALLGSLRHRAGL